MTNVSLLQYFPGKINATVIIFFQSIEWDIWTEYGSKLYIEQEATGDVREAWQTVEFREKS